MTLRRKQTDIGSLDADCIVWDEAVAGLGLRTQNGKRTWICRYRSGGV